MTSNSTPSGFASASGNTNNAYLAFDGDESTRWTTPSGSGNGFYLQYQLETAKRVNTIKILPFYNNTGRIKDFTLQGSNDGSSFTDLYTGTCQNSNKEQYFSIPNSVKYQYYRLLIKNNYSSSTDVSGVCEFQLYEPL